MSSTNNLRVLDIVAGTTVDGPGLRTSVYLAGCDHRCPGCHNPDSWDFGGGREMTVGEILEIVEQNGFNVTLTGGDPAYRAIALLPLVRQLHQRGYTVWMYTGFVYKDLLKLPGMEEVLPHLEAVVDGPYIENLKDPGLRFRGSSNQRIIYLNKKEDPVLPEFGW